MLLSWSVALNAILKLIPLTPFVVCSAIILLQSRFCFLMLCCVVYAQSYQLPGAFRIILIYSVTCRSAWILELFYFLFFLSMSMILCGEKIVSASVFIRHVFTHEVILVSLIIPVVAVKTLEVGANWSPQEAFL